MASGGVESAALLAQALRRYPWVYPLYVRKGFVWEGAELVHLRRLVRSFGEKRLAALTVLEALAGPVYGRHWSLGKRPAPGFKAPDSAVYLPGRNLLLLSLGGLFCGMRKIPALWIGILRGNPFSDATPRFLRRMESALGEALSVPVKVAAPLAGFTKPQVIRRWPEVPWRHTFSCLSPVKQRHCGRCQKCAERKRGFRLAGIADPTPYA